MWLFTRFGFFSAVCARKDGGKSKEIDTELMMVRARNKQHLVNLQEAFPCLVDTPIKISAGTDYHCRMIVPKTIWLGVVVELVVEQDYGNFKSECARTADDGAYLSVLHRIWGAAMSLQERAHGVGYGGNPVAPEKVAGFAFSDTRDDLREEAFEGLEGLDEAAQRARLIEGLVHYGCPEAQIDRQADKLMVEVRRSSEQGSLFKAAGE